MNGSRAWYFRAVLAAFLAASVWWIFHIPYAPRNLLRAAPQNTVWLSAHYDLAGRWESLADNPLLRTALTTVDPALVPPSEGKERETWGRILATLCPDETVLGYVPALGPSGAEVWFMASWLGGGSQRLRWRMGWLGPSLGLRENGRHGGRTLWRLDIPTAHAGATTAFALAEGLLLGCHSSDPNALRYLLDTVDRRHPSLADLPETAHDPGLGRDRPAPDRGWFIWNAERSLKGSYRLPAIGEQRFSVALRLDGAGLPAGSGPSARDLEVPGRLLGSRAFVSAVVERDWLWALMETYNPNVWADFLREALREQVDEPLVLALLGDEFSGSLRGFRIPTLVAAAPLAEPAVSWDGMHTFLDQWNARFGWGLIPRALTGSAEWAYALEGTGILPYANRDRDQQTALLVKEGWLFWGSHAGALLNMAASAGAPERPLDQRGCPASLCLRVDLRKGYPIAQLALTAYTFQHLLAPPPEAQRARGRVATARLWLEALRPFGLLQLQVTEEPTGMRLKAVLGENSG